jgi:hypothetical protein
MGIAIRHYLFPEEGEPRRLSQHLVNGLIHGQDAIIEYANTRQRVLSLYIETEQGRPIRIYRADGSIWTFDAEGRIRAALQESLREMMNAAFSAPHVENSTVVSIQPHLSRRRLAAKYRWEPAASDLDRDALDIWPDGKTAPLGKAKGVRPRRPPLTYDAKQALEEASRAFFSIYHPIDRLKEPSLKALIFEAEDRAAGDPEFGYLYTAVAEMAKERFEILRRRRSGKGTWYAQLLLIRLQDGIGETIQSYHEKCTNRAGAVAAARRLLSEHARMFSEDITVEAEIMPEVEWRKRRADQ